MKRVKGLKETAQGASQPITTGDILLVIAKQPASGQGINYEDMKARMRIMDVVEEAGTDAEEFLFEDSDYANLTRLTRTTQFGMADRALFNILEGILNADTPPKEERDAAKARKANSKRSAVEQATPAATGEATASPSVL